MSNPGPRRALVSDTGRGPATAALENAFATLTGTRHVLSFNCGTAALHAALYAAGVDPHAGVLTSPLTWISAILAPFHAGSFPIFADVEPDGINLDPAPATATAAGTAAVGCSAILVTHTWGIPARVDALTARPPAPVVEDCSHAHGARYAGRPVGSWGAARVLQPDGTQGRLRRRGWRAHDHDRRLYERAMLLGHHPHRLAAELTDPDLLALAGAPGWAARPACRPSPPPSPRPTSPACLRG